ncbi:MAG: PocR ligand-binding domain-containing protein, partial [Magnetococcales bacterium]|nr:PocR ligand-binding domain-containing protein [Magnetococcales bacterium]
MSTTLFQINSLSGKLLRIHLSLTTAAVLVLLLVLELDFYHDERARLVESLVRLVTVQESAIESAVWEFDLQHVRNLLTEQSRLPFFQSAEVRGKDNEILAAVGDTRQPPRSVDFRLERPLHRHKPGSDSTVIGHWVVTVHDDGIRKAMVQHFKVNGAILLTLLAALGAGTIFGVRALIGRPLAEFRNAIQRPLDAQIQSPLQWDRSDELGKVLLAYNAMLDARHHAEMAMLQREKELRKAVQSANESSAESERFNRLARGRELRMLELKNEINALSRELGRVAPFKVVERDDGENDGHAGMDTLTANQEADDQNLSLEAILGQADIQPLFEEFCSAVGVAAAITDLDGKILIASNWQRVCTDFHRVNPATCAHCLESDTVLSHHLQAGEEYAIYRCKNGLTDAASPIVVNGQHLANILIGQFHLTPPDKAFFQTQAQDVGFDEESYLAAIAEAPVMHEGNLPSILGFMCHFARLIATISIERLESRRSESALLQGRLAAMNLAEDAEKARAELTEYQKGLESLVEKRAAELREAEERSRLILDSVGEGIFGTDAQGKVHFINPAALKMLGRNADEVIGHTLHPLAHHSLPDGAPYPAEKCPMWRAHAHGVSAHVDDEYFWARTLPRTCASRT